MFYGAHSNSSIIPVDKTSIQGFTCNSRTSIVASLLTENHEKTKASSEILKIHKFHKALCSCSAAQLNKKNYSLKLWTRSYRMIKQLQLQWAFVRCFFATTNASCLAGWFTSIAIEWLGKVSILLQALWAQLTFETKFHVFLLIKLLLATISELSVASHRLPSLAIASSNCSFNWPWNVPVFAPRRVEFQRVTQRSV